MDPETVDGVNLSTDSAVPALTIRDSAALMNFKLIVTGSYTFEGETNSTSIELSYEIKSLFSAEFLRLSVKENQSPEAYSFDIEQ